MASTKHPNLNIRTILREGQTSATIVDVAEKAGWPTFTQEDIDGILGGNAAKFLRL